jgi:hypothetical protein
MLLLAATRRQQPKRSNHASLEQRTRTEEPLGWHLRRQNASKLALHDAVRSCLSTVPKSLKRSEMARESGAGFLYDVMRGRRQMPKCWLSCALSQLHPRKRYGDQAHSTTPLLPATSTVLLKPHDILLYSCHVDDFNLHMLQCDSSSPMLKDRRRPPMQQYTISISCSSQTLPTRFSTLTQPPAAACPLLAPTLSLHSAVQPLARQREALVVSHVLSPDLRLRFVSAVLHQLAILVARVPHAEPQVLVLVANVVDLSGAPRLVVRVRELLKGRESGVRIHGDAPRS